MIRVSNEIGLAGRCPMDNARDATIYDYTVEREIFTGFFIGDSFG